MIERHRGAIAYGIQQKASVLPGEGSIAFDLSVLQPGTWYSTSRR